MKHLGFSPEQAEAVRKRGDWQVIGSLLPFLWPARGVPNAVEIRVRVVFALVFILAAKIATVYAPIYLKHAVDILSEDVTLSSATAIPLALIIAYGAARFLGLAFAQFRDAVFAKVGVRAVRRSSAVVLTHLHRLSLRFHLDRRTGALSRSIERGRNAIESLVSISLFNVLPTILEVALVFVILWKSFNIWFGLVTLAVVVIYVAFTSFTTEWRLKFRRDSNALDNKANTRAIDSLLNYETVKTFGNEDLEVREYDRVMGQYEAASVRTQSTLALMNVGQAFIISVGLAVLMAMAASGKMAGNMTVGDFTLVNLYMLQLSQPLNFFGFVYRNIKQALVDIEKMFDLMDVEPEIKDKPDAPELRVAGGEVRFENVSFAYDPRRPILKNVSFTVSPGKMTAFVGATGAGKSTIGRLLFRYYDVNGGAIKIDGQDIRDVTQSSVRAALGVVPQDTVLFNDTIGYNLGYAKPDAPQEDIARAAQLAHIQDLIARLPDGYETLVGERGLKLSGGEKQRVAIARVILKGAPILIFDEATSALDTHTEKEIQANLREVSTGRTTLVIAHRLSTIVDADQILVLGDGDIIERGTHAELLRQGGTYASAWAKQQKSMAVAPEDPDAFASAAKVAE
ncbi:MAG: ABC transporter ATP-binding protein/permease [Rhodospirillaceae bacterium]|nr:ABC transporter ATP-binding protein/permease [Rhodospirillaceae bacterium]